MTQTLRHDLPSLARMVAAEADLTPAVAQKAIQAFATVARSALLRGEEVPIRGVGVLHTTVRISRVPHHYADGSRNTTTAGTTKRHLILRVRPSHNLRTHLKIKGGTQ